MPDPVQQKSWFSRNLKWVVLGCGGVLVLGIGFSVFLVVGIMSIMKSSDAFKISFQQVQSNAEVQNALGTPVKDGWYVMGNVNVTPESGAADIGYPISGPKGTATVHVQATKAMGVWHINQLSVAVDGQAKSIQVITTSDKSPSSGDTENPERN